MGCCCSKPPQIIPVSTLPKSRVLDTQADPLPTQTKMLIYEAQTINKDIKTHLKMSKAKLGEGHYGSVRKSDHSYPNVPEGHLQPYATKTIIKKRMKGNLAALALESKFLQTADHPSIIRFHSKFEDQTYYHLTTELCSGGPFLTTLQAPRLTELQASHYLFKIFSLVNYLHQTGICHRDLKLDNLLLSSPTHKKIKLIDFGQSKFFDTTDPCVEFNSTVGDPSYVAPDVINDFYDCRCDIWSLGVVMFVV